MSLESILNRIFNEAKSQQEGILQEAGRQAEAIIKQAKTEAEALYQEMLNKGEAVLEDEKKKLLVNARLETKKNVLASKQELIDSIFLKLRPELKKDKIKKQIVSSDKVEVVNEDIDFYLDGIRLEYETEIAKILFS